MGPALYTPHQIGVQSLRVGYTGGIRPIPLVPVGHLVLENVLDWLLIFVYNRHLVLLVTQGVGLYLYEHDVVET